MKVFNNLKQINIVRTFNLVHMKKNVVIALAIGVFAVANLLISSVPLRYDLSYGKAYTLSSSTKNILRNLDNLVTIKFFVSSDLPSRLLPLKTEVTDILNEYNRANAGKISIKIIDPKKDEKVAAEAKEAGIPELQFSQVEQDKYAITTALFGISLQYKDKKEVIPQATNLESLEYNLTAAIYKMTRKELPKIGIMGADSANPQGDGLSVIKGIASKQFAVESIHVSSSSATRDISPSFKTLMVMDTNTKQYDQQEQNALKSYLAKNGKAIFFVDGISVSEQLQTAPSVHNLTSFLESYGIQLNKNLVLSTAAERINLGQGNVTISLPYPLWLRTNIFNTKTTYFSNIGALTFPWSSSISLHQKPGMEQDELIKTTPRSWIQEKNYSLDPQSIPPPKESDLKEFVIGAQARLKNGGTIIVIPSSRFIYDRYLSPTSNNVGFVLNLLNDLASDGVLSGISQRSVKFYQMPDMPENQKDLFKYGNILLLPALLSVFGAIHLMRRK